MRSTKGLKVHWKFRRVLSFITSRIFCWLVWLHSSSHHFLNIERCFLGLRFGVLHEKKNLPLFLMLDGVLSYWNSLLVDEFTVLIMWDKMRSAKIRQHLTNVHRDNILHTITTVTSPGWIVDTRQNGFIILCCLHQIPPLPYLSRQRNSSAFYQSSLVKFQL